MTHRSIWSRGLFTGNRTTERILHGLILIILPLLCARCAGSRHAPPGEEAATPTAREGYVDAGGGIRLFYRIVGDGGDTVVVLHGGPGRSTLVTDSVSLDARRLRVAAVLNRFPIL